MYANRDTQTLSEKSRKAGGHGGLYSKRLLDGPLPWTRMRHVHRLLGLVGQYGPARVDQACGRALDQDVVDVTRVARMLARVLQSRPSPDPTRPTTTATALRFARPVVGVRSQEFERQPCAHLLQRIEHVALRLVPQI